MNAADLNADLLRFAASDLRAARREGSIMITQTRRGLLSLSYDAGRYVLSTTGLDAEVIAEGKAGAVKAAIAGCYDVQ